jgi:hypothetical protein
MIPFYRTMRVAMVAVMTMTNTLYSQHLSSARGIALGGYTTLSAGTTSLDWNPAGLVFVKDWEFTASNYLSTAGTLGIVFHSAGLSKRFLNDHATALRYSPGKSLELVVPTTIRFADTNVVIQTEFDKRVIYEEPYALGYAYRLNNELSFGLVGRFLNEKVSDTKYILDTSSSTIRSQVVDYQGSVFLVDVGLQWAFDEGWGVGVVAKNLFNVMETQLSDDVAQFRLDMPRLLCVGASYSVTSRMGFWTMGFDGNTERRFRAGVEWSTTEIGSLKQLSFRAGSYFDARSHPILDALAIGVGGVYEFMEVDVSFLKFVTQTNRKGRADLSAFDGGSILDVEFNKFTADRVSTTVRFYLGRTRETAARIEGVRILSEVYPSSSRTHSHTPLAEVYVRNITEKPIEATVSFFVERLMNVPTESQFVRIEPGERAGVPLYAIFNDQIHSVLQSSIREGFVYVTTRRGEDHDDRFQIRLPVHGRNDWNGDVNLLKYFVTPDDPDVLQFTRGVLNEHKDRVDSAQGHFRNFLRARILFDDFTGRLTYVNDPKKSQDHVQYPSETLALRGGDCDDLTVCYASQLLSIGIPTAFIDVIPPGKPDESHIYMMFDTGVGAENAHIISDNPKRFVVRKNIKGEETVWIPVETTVITKGFDEAWSVGAKEYYEDVEVGLGLVKGWVTIVDVQSAYY